MGHLEGAPSLERILLLMNPGEYWIQKLGLARHPEGGYYREIYRSSEGIPRKGLPDRYDGPRFFSTSMYYLLSGEEVSYFHRLKSDEIWHFYRGSFLSLYVISPEGRLGEIQIGSDIEAGQVFQTVIPAGHWFAASVGEPDSYSLVGCTVAPGFDFRDFEFGQRNELLAVYPQHQAIIKKLTRI